jgi:hypothetical protein
VSMRSIPSSSARRRTRLASSGSSGGPQMPLPVIRMAPKPRRRTSRSPPMVKVSMASTLATGRFSYAAEPVSTRPRRRRFSAVSVRLR